MTILTTRTSRYDLTCQSENPAFQTEIAVTAVEPGIDLVSIRLTTSEPAIPSPVTIAWTLPIVDIHSSWNPASDLEKNLLISSGFGAKVTTKAPVISLHNLAGHNRLTFAYSDGLHAVRMQAEVHDQSSTYACAVRLFTEGATPFTVYEETLRLDTRDVPFYTSLDDVQRWWAIRPDYAPIAVPEHARLPMYSSWYSFRQHVSADALEHQCRLAKALGCEGIIVDDGWQTVDTSAGYGYCGDWSVAREKIPDMKAHVARVHELGMKYLLWYATPFAGKYSQAYQRFADRLLNYREEVYQAGVLDPRYPDIREYLITIFERALRDWDLDGFKLDFIDSFSLQSDTAYAQQRGEGQDYVLVVDAVDRLLAEMIQRLQKIKPDVLIEFRQSYIGPRLKKYANMFRAVDCPNDALVNRARTIDVRLLNGRSATHSDMFTWNSEEPVESAALQLINGLFSVPQLSVMIDTLPQRHIDMVRFWLSFWREHRDVLLDGTLMPVHPEGLYPLVQAVTDKKHIAVIYHDMVVNPGLHVPRELMLVNGTQTGRVVLELDEAIGSRTCEIRDCCGVVLSDEKRLFDKGLTRLEIPASGLAILK
ncbi:hypothetical protein KDA_51490 [Dictyobacter alpinus]|uniref:Alpha-galactosidase n=1 Tax=Dictyobacter alpinus TaxID=2014873 RepID=A0A402BE73_9CHLR|nr:glycoside hydrolase family 36 protein [Dictyobacter alpinus]GCE29665.1 hypothetical protein KDA_51490 [Dictyobacter alpinus]